MNGKRAGAVAIAVALVFGAFFVRRQIDGSSITSDSPSGRGPSALSAVCAPEAATACQAMGLASVSIERPGDTAARLAKAGGLLGTDIWVTPSFWPAMVTELARQANNDSPASLTVSPVIARTALAFVTRRDRAQALAGSCAGVANWACITTKAGDPWSSLGGQAGWGQLTIGLDNIATSSGLMGVAAATVAHFGRSDLATNDFDDDETFGSVLTRLASSAPTSTAGGNTPLERYLRIPATAASVIEIDAVARPAVAASRDVASIERGLPTTLAVADLVIAGPTAANINSIDRTRWSAALVSAGWSTPDTADLPAPSGLPPAGVLVALTTRWKQIAQ